MPSLITKRKKPNPVPPCGRRIVYVNPHSPFQKLVESKRLKLGKSIRELAEEISEATPRESTLNPGSLWIWLRNTNGYPHPKSATKGRLRALARVLRVPLPLLEEKLDISRHLFTAREHSEPKRSQKAIVQFLEIMRNDKRIYVSKARVVNLAQSLLDSSKPGR